MRQVSHPDQVAIERKYARLVENLGKTPAQGSRLDEIAFLTGAKKPKLAR